MILKEFNIDGFGVFNDFSLTGLGRGINIVEGNNEAGKSTLLNFIRYTLFGYPSGKNNDQCLPLNGGSHGGRITAVLSDRQEVTFERMAGSKKGKIQLHHADGRQSKDELEWYKVLGNSSPQLFNNIYGFGLNELLELKQLDDSGIQDKIYSIGLGLAKTSIGEVENKLVFAADKIYKEKGRVQELVTEMAEIDQLKVEVKEIQNSLPRYNQLLVEISFLEKKRQDSQPLLRERGERKDLLINYLKCYDDYVSILQTDRDLKVLPSSKDCPIDGLLALQNLLQEKSRLENQKNLSLSNRDNNGFLQLQEQLERVKVDEKILSEEPSIQILLRHIEKYKQTQVDFADAERKIKEINAQIRSKLQRISSDWSENNLETFSNTIEHKHKIQEFANRINNAKVAYEAKKQSEQQTPPKITKVRLPVLLAVIVFIIAIPTFFYTIPYGIALLVISVIIVVLQKIFFTEEFSHSKTGTMVEEASLNNIAEEYQDYLRKDLKLDSNLPCNAVIDILNVIDQTKEELNNRNIIVQKQVERTSYIENFELKLHALAARVVPNNQGWSNEELVFHLRRQLDRNKEQLEVKKRLENLFLVKKREVESVKEELRINDESLRNLFKEASVNNQNEFEQKWADEEKTRALQREKDSALKRIETVVGFGKSNEVFQFLNSIDRIQLQAKINELEVEITELGNERDEIIKKQVELQNEMKLLMGQSSISEKETELAVKIKKLKTKYKEWLKHKIAFNVLSKVKQSYEVNKQPDVVKYASKQFSSITANKYSRINISLDDKNVTVVDSMKKAKSIHELSRGTKEQLLISLRLGLIEEYEKRNEPLPIILDDVFVNFDPCRTKSIAEVLETFSEKRQIIIFTCHPNTAKNFSKVIKKNLDNSSILQFGIPEFELA